MGKFIPLAAVKGNTPEQMVKAAIKQSAVDLLKENEYPERLTVTISAEGIAPITFDATPTAGLKDGRIMYHAGGKATFKGHKASFGGNLFLDVAAVSEESLLALKRKHGVKLGSEVLSQAASAQIQSDKDMEEGESTE